ncbi:MAG: 50S ribosomal protein L23 [Candidatus Ryanbacteria bacterium]|nr:50S ribosomal protein L23 [Candidatus Ryanbacteria bacterium]
MALLPFLKKKEKVEKHVADHESHDHDHVDSKPMTRFEGVERAVLIAPHVTERARQLSENGQYVFRIATTANKQAVRKAVERAYKVHVTDVNIITAHEKPRRRGLTEGVKRGYKKAVVALRRGETIDIF